MPRVVNPYDQSVVCDLPYHTDREIAVRVESAESRLKAWRAARLEERVERVQEALQSFADDAEAIARDVTLQMGKPINQARGEVATLLERGRQSIVDAKVALAPDFFPAQPGLVRRIEHEPLGIVLNIAAWNYPLLIPVNVVVPALLAGNVVLLKHSVRTPLTGQAFERAFSGLVTNLRLSHTQTTNLIGDRRVDHVSFTGSVAGGRSVYRAVSERLIDAGLELGGKDPAYVAADADVDASAAAIVDGACYNAGQSCCAIERVYVHRSRYESFLAKAENALREYRLGDPLQEDTTMGPMASSSGPGELRAQVDDAVRRGARVAVANSDPANLGGNFYPPTLVIEVPNDALIMQEESFGPLLPVSPVDDDEEALERMNDSRYGLTASIWTRDQERVERLAKSLRVGTVYQNRSDYLDPALPWTGCGESGKGSTLSRYGFYHLTRRKSLHFRTELPRQGSNPGEG